MRFHRQAPQGLLLMGLLLGTLAACAPQIPSLGTSAGMAPLFCSEAQPILFDRLGDTAATIAQIKAYNAVGVKLCGWSGPEK